MPYSWFIPPTACPVRSSPLATASARALGRVSAIASSLPRVKIDKPLALPHLKASTLDAKGKKPPRRRDRLVIVCFSEEFDVAKVMVLIQKIELIVTHLIVLILVADLALLRVETPMANLRKFRTGIRHHS